jgi:hypothetical protein
MTRVPFAVLAVGWAGMIPFLYGIALIFAEAGSLPTLGFFSADAVGGVRMLERFGAVVLAFMGGCLWGFSSGGGRAPAAAATLGAAALPALWAALAIQPTPELSCIWLAIGFGLLQALDIAFQRSGIAPAYWLSLRLPLTAGVMACLLVGALYG